jgi:hypothetical protein
VSAELKRVAEADLLVPDSGYYDTAEFDLLRNGVALRRIGAVDEGWQLKLPTSTPGSRSRARLEPMGFREN